MSDTDAAFEEFLRLEDAALGVERGRERDALRQFVYRHLTTEHSLFEVMGERDALTTQLAEARAEAQAVAEAMRDACAKECDNYAGESAEVCAAAIRALPVPTAALQRVREEARQRGYDEGLAIGVEMAHEDSERRGAERALDRLIADFKVEQLPWRIKIDVPCAQHEAWDMAIRRYILAALFPTPGLFPAPGASGEGVRGE